MVLEVHDRKQEANGNYQEKELWFIIRCAICSTEIFGRILVKDKVRGAEKVDRGPGGVCDNGIFWRIKRRVGTVAITEGRLVFLGRESPTQYTTYNAYVKGGV